MLVPISKLQPNPDNPRTIKDANFKKLVKSIKEFPEMADVREIVVNKDYMILGGNMRYQAMKEAGWKEVPVRVVDWSEDKQREFIIKDNVSGGDWDWDILADQWDKQQLEDWGLDIEEWSADEVVEDEAPEVLEVAESVLGEVYQLGRHRLMCGDSTKIEDVEKLMDGKKADMVFTDPPFNIGYQYETYDDSKSPEEYYRMLVDSFTPHISDKVSFYVMQRHSNTKIQWQMLEDMGLEYVNMIIWKNQSQSHPSTKYDFSYQPILFFRGKEAKFNEYGDKRDKPEDYWSASGVEFKGKMNDLWIDIKPISAGVVQMSDLETKNNKKLHSAEMPTKLPLRAILMSSDNKDVVVDMFGGSGSTLIACEQTNRTCFMMELDPKYVDVIRRRYHKFVTGSEDGWQEATPRV